MAELKPILLLLDPFVRLHRIDENASQEVAPLLGYLRELQRQHHLAVVLVHHARKGAQRLRPGQALRGSSEFHAWGDSNLYLRRGPRHQLSLTIEHRAAASDADIPLALNGNGDQVALEVLDRPALAESPEPTSAAEKLLGALQQALGGWTQASFDFPGPAPGNAQGSLGEDELLLGNNVLTCAWSIGEEQLKPGRAVDKQSGITLDLNSFSIDSGSRVRSTRP